jgi:hypothetical protein
MRLEDLVDRVGDKLESACRGRGMQPSVPGGERETVTGEHQRGGEMERIQAAQLTLDRDLGGVLDETLIYLDHAEAGPLLAAGLGDIALD